jgi:hypothetical protein
MMLLEPNDGLVVTRVVVVLSSEHVDSIYAERV